MRVDGAKYEGGNLILHTMDIAARRFPYKFKPGEYEIRLVRKKRSLDANAYCWLLCSKIADTLQIKKEEAYRNSIREGSEYTPLPIRENAVEEFQRVWSGHGIGWFAEVADNSKLPGYKLVFAYHGSSVYDTKSMALLIDRLVQDAKALDIEVLSEREITLLKESWNGAKKN